MLAHLVEQYFGKLYEKSCWQILQVLEIIPINLKNNFQNFWFELLKNAAFL
jgi:hypothetical protein